MENEDGRTNFMFLGLPSEFLVLLLLEIIDHFSKILQDARKFMTNICAQGSENNYAENPNVSIFGFRKARFVIPRQFWHDHGDFQNITNSLKITHFVSFGI